MGGCTWEVVHGRLYMEGCTWESVHESLYMGGCTWKAVHGRLYMGVVASSVAEQHSSSDQQER